MFENKKRIKSYLETIIQETELIPEMLEDLEAGKLDRFLK